MSEQRGRSFTNGAIKQTEGSLKSFENFLKQRNTSKLRRAVCLQAWRRFRTSLDNKFATVGVISQFQQCFKVTYKDIIQVSISTGNYLTLGRIYFIRISGIANTLTSRFVLYRYPKLRALLTHFLRLQYFYLTKYYRLKFNF